MKKNTTSQKRWTDNVPVFIQSLRYIRDLPSKEQEDVLLFIRDKIEEYDPNLIKNHLEDFPLDLYRRWYDKDPLCWVIINSLKYTSPQFREKIGKLVLSEMESLPPQDIS